MKETLTRSLTGLVYVAVILLSLLLHTWAYLILFTLICILAWIEYVNLFPQRVRTGMQAAGALLTSSLFITGFFIMGGRAGWILLLVPGFILAVLLLRDQANRIAARRLRMFIFLTGIIYLALPLATLHIMGFRLGPEGEFSHRYILFTFVFLWTYDTMAYVCGRLAGRHVIRAEISPGKTWEGAVGGALFTVMLALVLSRYETDLNLLQWVFFAIVAVVSGTAGDFLESGLKRSAGVKDSGKLLPGHGGILDRIDSLLVSAPFITLYLYLVMH